MANHEPAKMRQVIGSCASWIVLVLVLYPLSFGPACWIASREAWALPVVSAVYRPLMAVAVSSPLPFLFDAIFQWGRLFDMRRNAFYDGDRTVAMWMLWMHAFPDDLHGVLPPNGEP